MLIIVRHKYIITILLILLTGCSEPESETFYVSSTAISGALKAIDQNPTFDFEDIEKVSGHVSKEPVIAFRDICFYVSVSAADKLQLKQFSRVRFSVLKGETFDETEKLYIRPNNDDFGHNTDNYLVIESKRNTGGITISGVASLYKKIPKLGKFLEYRDNVNKRIAIKLCDKTGLWYMPLTSMFEKTVWDNLCFIIVISHIS